MGWLSTGIKHVWGDILNLPTHVWNHTSGWGSLTFIQIAIAFNLGFHSERFFASFVRKLEDSGHHWLRQLRASLETYRMDSFRRTQASQARHQEDGWTHVMPVLMGAFKTVLLCLVEVFEVLLGALLASNVAFYRIAWTFSWISICLGIALIYFNHASRHSWLMVAIWPLYLVYLFVCVGSAMMLGYLLNRYQRPLTIEVAEQILAAASQAEVVEPPTLVPSGANGQQNPDA